MTRLSVVRALLSRSLSPSHKRTHRRWAELEQLENRALLSNAYPSVTGFAPGILGSATITFDQPIDAAKIDLFTDIWVSDENDAWVPGVFIFNDDNTQMTWWSGSSTFDDIQWTIHLRAQDATDFTNVAGELLDGDDDGNPGGDYEHTWRPNASVVSVTQFTGNADGSAVITFSEPIKTDNLQMYNDVWVYDQDSNGIYGSISWNNAKTQMTFTPVHEPAADGTFTINLAAFDSSDFANNAGELLDGDGDGIEGGDYAHTWNVTSAYPAIPEVMGASGLADGSILIIFNKPMLTNNVDNDSDLWVYDSQDNLVEGFISWSDDERQLTWTPNEAPAVSDTWTITLESGDSADFIDYTGTLLDGNSDGTPGDDFNYSWNVTGAAPSFPTVTHITAGTDGLVTIDFSEAIDMATVDNYTDIFVINQDGETIDGSFGYTTDQTRLIWGPKHAPTSSEIWLITLTAQDSTDFVDRTGGDLLDGDHDGDAGGNYSYDFIVEPPPPGYPSVVSAVGQTSGVMTITFDVPIDTATVDNELDMWVTDADNKLVKGSISWNAAQTQMTWTPWNSPTANTLWKITLTAQDNSDFIDHAGHLLDGDGNHVAGGNYIKNWNVIPPPPKFPKVTKFDGKTDGTVTIEFNKAIDSAGIDNFYDLWVTDAGSHAIAGTIAWSADELKMTWKPDRAPAASGNWTITLASIDDSDFVDHSGAMLDGNNDGSAGGSYAKAWAVIAVPPVSPKVTQFDARTDGTVTIDFSQAIIASNIDNFYDIWVNTPNGTQVTGSIAFSNGDKRMTWTPVSAPTADTTWTITLAGADDTDFTNTAGVILDGNNDNTPGGDYVRSWAVKVPPPNYPSVTQFDASATGQVTIDFSQPIASSNVDNYSDIWVADANGTVILGTLKWNTAETRLIWSPAQTPIDAATWTITLQGKDSTDFMNHAGKLLDGDGDHTAGGNFVKSFNIPGAPIKADYYESNDTRFDAAALDLLGPSTAYINLTMDAVGDDDWYAFTIGSTGTAADRAFISFTQAKGNLDITLYDITGKQLATSAGASTNGYDEVSLMNRPAGRYYLKVSGQANPNYSLHINAPMTAAPDWTVLIYANGDSNLDDWYYGDLVNATKLNLPSDVKVAVMYDRGPHANKNATTWSDTRRGPLITSTTVSLPLEAMLTTMGEVNMGIPATLTSFIQWGVTNFPADHYMLMVSDHGGGIEGISWDDTSSGNHMSVPQLGTALANSGVHFDILELYSCLNGMVEVAAEVAPYADYLVASEEVSYTGLFSPQLEVFKKTTDHTPKTLASNFAAKMSSSTAGNHEENGHTFTTTHAATRLDKIAALETALLNFVNAAQITSNSDWTHISAAAKASYQNYYNTSRDLGRFLRAVRDNISVTQNLRNKAGAAAAALDAAVVARFSNGNTSDGLAITLATTPPQGYASKVPAFIAATHWDQFLTALKNHGAVVMSLNLGDWSEPNDSIDNPYELPPIQGADQTLPNARIDSVEDEDWFRIELSSTGNAQSAISLTSAVPGLDLVLRLYDAGGLLLTSSDTENSADETVSLLGLTAGIYYFSVTAGALSSTGNYDITLSAPAPALGGDWADPNHTSDRAYPLGVTPGTMTPYPGLITDATPDWFSFDLPVFANGGDGYIELVSSSASPLTLTAFDSAGHQLGTGTVWHDGATRFDIPARSAGTIRFRVTGTAAGQSYGINLQAPSVQLLGGGPTLDFAISAAAGSLKFTDTDGTLVTLALTGAGTVSAHLLGENLTVAKDGKLWVVSGTDVKLDSLVFGSTTAASNFTVTTAGGTIAGTTLNTIRGGTPLGKFTATTLDLIGDGIDMSGYIGTLTLSNITSGADVRMTGTPPAAGITLKLLTVGQGSDFELPAIASFTAEQVLGGSITAPSITTLKISGNARKLIAGNAVLDLNLGSIAFSPTQKILKTATVAGTLSNSSWLVDGKIGSVTLGRLVNSRIFSGVSHGATLPSDNVAFNTLGSIDSLTLKGTAAGPSLVRSNIAAWKLTKVVVKDFDSANIPSGTKFGLSAHSMDSVTFNEPLPVRRHTKLTGALADILVADDLVLRLV